MATTERDSPNAIIHHRILQHAESEPDASLEAIAAEVSGASVDLVERVLDSYGDPAESQETSSDGSTEPAPKEDGQHSDDESTSSEAKAVPAWNELSQKLQETLREVYDHPDATQEEIANTLGVTSPTVSNRLSQVEGFDWAAREAFVEQLPEPEIQTNGTKPTASDMTELETPGTDEESRSTADSEDGDELIDAELVHRVIRVCMESGEFTKDEEIELIARLT